MVESTSHMCLEAHKHKGTTFQGTQISTLPLTEESALHHQSHPCSGYGCLLKNTQYGCTLINKSRLTQICSICVIHRWKCLSTYPRSPRSWYQTKDLNLGLPPRISTSWHLAKSHSLGISPRVTLLASHQ